jgi:hypothetical protein
MLNFNTEPYNDDFSEDNKFYRILFRPSFAVQARELTQLQTILQNQISKHGNYVFKQGAMIVPGQVSIDKNFNYVKLKTSYGQAVTESFIQSTAGKFVTGVNSGVKAQIIKVVSSTATDPTTLYIRYTNSGTNNETKVFPDEEVITVDDTGDSFQAIATAATGVGSGATVERGVYYVNGNFVLCADPITGLEQTIILTKYTNSPTYRIGLQIVETTVIPEDDETLLDNAQTSYNFAAPGAHRFHIDLILTKKLIDDEDDENFIQLLQVEAGIIKRIVNKTEFSELEKTFARRTYDESGNYDVRPFTLDVRDARTNNRGQWVTGTTYYLGDIVSNGGRTYVSKSKLATTSGDTAPTHTDITGTSNGPVKKDGTTGVSWEYTEAPNYNRGISLDGSADKLAIVLDPGKAYVQGYEIEKVSTSYVYVDKCRDSTHQVQVTEALVPATVGNYVIVNSINSAPRVDTYETVDLYDRFTVQGLTTSLKGTAVGTKVGTARIRGIEWHNGTIGTTDAQYKVMLFDIKMNSGKDFNRNVKSFYYNAGSTVTNFTADIVPVSSSLQGDVTNVASVTLTGTITTLTNSTTITGTSTTFTSQVPVNSNIYTSANVYIGTVKSVTNNTTLILQSNAAVAVTASASAICAGLITGGNTEFTTALLANDYVYVGSNIRRVISVNGQQSITIDYPATVTRDTIQKITTEIKEPNNETLLFPLPYYAIKTVKAADGTNKITYNVSERLTNQAGSIQGISPNQYCTLTVVSASGEMASAAETDNFQVIDTTTGLTVAVDPANITINISSATFTLPSAYAGRSFVVIATIIKRLSGGSPKAKTLQGTTATYTSKAAAQANTIDLGVADGYRIITIKQATGFAWDSSPAIADYDNDVSDRYDFDDGQTASFYGTSKLQLKPSFSPPNYPIRVVFEYFSHGTGDYFTVDSYPDLDYKDIPNYNNISLRDVIDFRPRIGNSNTSFATTGASLSLVPKRGYYIQADFSYYLPRTDKIAIDFNGNFFQIKGVPSLNTVTPSDPTIGMVLYTINLEPYTFSTTANSVIVTKHDNKRYTMRDIGKLEKRIDTLEYYTSLSMLEQETQSLEIIDNATGLNRFKNGFIVDNFAGHKTGDVLSADYFCSIDMENNELRPFYNMQNVNMVERNTSNSGRISDLYQITGDLITLPIIAQPALVTQPYGSRLENINPFAIFTFLGDVKMNPSSDEWFEVDRRPDIIQNEEGDFDTIATLAEKAGVLGTIWNAWQTQWAGTPVDAGSYTVTQYS